MKFKEMNLPNKLTTIRMICVPIMFLIFISFMLFKYLSVPSDYLIFQNGESSYLTICQILMAVIFAFASITDFFDGKIARKNNLVSEYGMLMDPLADKLLVNSTLILMLASGMFLIGQESFLVFEIITMIFVGLSIARDIFVDALRMQALKHGKVVSAKLFGKLKTATLMPGIVITLLGSIHPIMFGIGLVFICFGSLFSLIGGAIYFKEMKDLIGN